MEKPTLVINWIKKKTRKERSGGLEEAVNGWDLNRLQKQNTVELQWLEH